MNTSLNKIFTKIVLMSPNQGLDFLQNFKDNFNYLISDQDKFLNFFKSYGIDLTSGDYYTITADPTLLDKINATYNTVMQNIKSPLAMYKGLKEGFGFTHSSLEALLKAEKVLKVAKKSGKFAKTTITLAMSLPGWIFSGLIFVVNLIFSIFGFLFSTPGLVVVFVLIVIVVFITIILILLMLMYQPLLNVPVKFSSYEMYVPLNNQEVAFKNNNTILAKIKNKFKEEHTTTSKILDTLTMNLANKNNVLGFLRNNQLDLAKGFLYKCSQFSLAKELLIEYKKQQTQLSGQIQQLSGQILQIEQQISGFNNQLSGLNKQIKQLQPSLIKLTDNLVQLSNLQNTVDFITTTGVNGQQIKQLVYTGTLPVFDGKIFLDNIATGLVLSGDGYLYKEQTRLDTLTGYIISLSNQKQIIASQIDMLTNKIKDIQQTIDDLKKQKRDLLVKLNIIKNKYQSLASLYKKKLRKIGVENVDTTFIQGDLFDNGFGVSRLFYTWYKHQLTTKGYKINEEICSDPVKYAYKAYIAPSWKKYNDTMVPGAEAYTMVFLDNIADYFNKKVDHNISQADYTIFQKYYNSIVGLYKQLGKILILKNWISGNFSVKPDGLLGMDVLTNDNQSVVNIYNPFTFQKFSIKLLDNTKTNLGSKKYFVILSNGFKIDVTPFNNWFYSYGANKLNDKLYSTNAVDIIYDNNTKTTYLPLNITTKTLQNECGIQDIQASDSLKMFVKIDGQQYYDSAVQHVKLYKECVEDCGKKCDTYKRCFVPIFIKGEKKDKQQELQNAVNNQLDYYCSQVQNYINKYQSLDIINSKQPDKFDKEPSKIQVCYQDHPVFFNYMFKYNISVYNIEGKLFGGKEVSKFLDTREDKYHYTSDGMYVPYLYKVSIPYKVCYTISDIYLDEKLKEKLTEKGGIIKNWNKPKLGFVINSHISLNLVSDLFFDKQSYPTLRQTNKLLFELLNKGASFNPEKLLDILQQKEKLVVMPYLSYSASVVNNSVNYRTYDFDPQLGKQLITTNPAVAVRTTTRTTSQMDRNLVIKESLEATAGGYIIEKEPTKYGYKIVEHSFGDLEDYLLTLHNYVDILAPVLANGSNSTYLRNGNIVYYSNGGLLNFDNERIKKAGYNNTLDYLLDKHIINTFKLKENLFISTVLNFIKNQLFNIDLSDLNLSNNIQSLLLFGDNQQVNNYYNYVYNKQVVTQKLTKNLANNFKDTQEQIEKNLASIKNKLAAVKKQKQEGTWDKIKSFFSDVFSTIANSVSQVKSFISDAVSNTIASLKERYYILRTNIPNSCIFSLSPAKCIVEHIDVRKQDNNKMLEYLFSKFVLENAKPGMNANNGKVYAKDIFGKDMPKLIYTLGINSKILTLNPFYSLFRKVEDKTTEQRIGIYSKVSNILTTTNPHNVLQTYGIDKFDIQTLIANMLSNQYIIDRLIMALSHIRLHGYDTTALDNLSKLKYDDIDIYDVNRILFDEFVPFNDLDASNIKKYLTDYYIQKKNNPVKITIPLYNLWFIYHASKKKYHFFDQDSILLSQLDKTIQNKIGTDKFAALVKGIEENNITFPDLYHWWSFNKGEIQYEAFKEVIEQTQEVFKHIQVCLPNKDGLTQETIVGYKENPNSTGSVNDIANQQSQVINAYCYKLGQITLKSNNTNTIKLLQYLYNTDNSSINMSNVDGLLTLVDFLSYYGNNQGLGGLDLRELFMITGPQPFSKANILAEFLIRNKKFFKEGYVDLNMDTNWLYRLFNRGKIGNQNNITYTTYLTNFFSQTNYNIQRLYSLFKLLNNIKNNQQIYEVADIYLLDLLANQYNYLSNIAYIPGIHTYDQVNDWLNASYIPIFEQYSLFDAMSKKSVLDYLRGQNNNIDLSDYYFQIFKQEFKKQIQCNKIFTGENIGLRTTCSVIKDDLLQANNLTDFKFRMSKYAKLYGFEELWKQVGGFLYFVYQNQKYMGQAWNFKDSIVYKKLIQKYGPGWINKIAGAAGNCTWYTNFLHFGNKLPEGGGIGGHAKDWCTNAEKMGYKVVWTKDVVNPMAQLRIGDVVVFNEIYPTYYNYQIKKYHTLYGHVATLIGIDPNYNAILVEEMNFKSYIAGGDTLWSVDRRWDTDRKNSVKCFIEIPSFNWSYDANNTNDAGKTSDDTNN